MLKKGLFYTLILSIGFVSWSQDTESAGTSSSAASSSSVSTSAPARPEKKSWKDEDNIASQYKMFREDLPRYTKYVYFEPSLLDEYHKSVSDTINRLKSGWEATRKTVAILEEKVETLKASQKSVQEELDVALEEGSSISVFGANVDKLAFASVMWIAVFVLIGLCGFVFVLFKRSNILTSQAQKDFQDLNDEFEQSRKNTLEKERKLRRELQDYINKIEELKQKGRA